MSVMFCLRTKQVTQSGHLENTFFLFLEKNFVLSPLFPSKSLIPNEMCSPDGIMSGF